MTWGARPQSGDDNGPAFSEPEPIPTLDQIKQNLLEVRNHTHFNIGSPQAIDHLLVSLVAVIDAIQEKKGFLGRRWDDETKSFVNEDEVEK